MRLTTLVLATMASTSVLAADLSGKYLVEGSNPGGAGGYKGTLDVTKAGDAYALTWNAGGISKGVGVVIGDSLAVAVGAGCSVAGYRTRAEGGLDCAWTGPNGGTVASEQAAPGVGTTKGLIGDYVVNGTNPDGKPYKGGLSLAMKEGMLRLSWRTGTNFEGFGIEQEGRVAAAWGAPDCGVVLYRITTDGVLSGIWRYPTSAIGNETAKR